MRLLHTLFALLLIVAISACSTTKDKAEDEPIPSAEEMYNQAFDDLGSKRYERAIEQFEEIEKTYPYAKWAIRAQVMSAYASYQDSEYTDAINTIDRFTKLHPGNANIDYMYYLKALCYYEQISNVDKDQSYSLYAQSALKEVMARFPDSKYARDANIKLELVRDHLAGKEVAVGLFYLKRGNYIGAINRFKRVVKEYQNTSHIEESLHRLVEANMALGLVGEAKKYAAVLGHNYPSSKWYKYSYNLIEGKPNLFVSKPSVKLWEKIPMPKLKIPFFGDDQEEEEVKDDSSDT